MSRVCHIARVARSAAAYLPGTYPVFVLDASGVRRDAELPTEIHWRRHTRPRVVQRVQIVYVVQVAQMLHPVSRRRVGDPAEVPRHVPRRVRIVHAPMVRVRGRSPDAVRRGKIPTVFSATRVVRHAMPRPRRELRGLRGHEVRVPVLRREQPVVRIRLLEYGGEGVLRLRRGPPPLLHVVDCRGFCGTGRREGHCLGKARIVVALCGGKWQGAIPLGVVVVAG